jgi:hypothetical protein
MKSCCKDNMETQAAPPTPASPKKRGKLSTWLKRIGVAGFLFFLLKGLAWVFVLWGGSRMMGCS